MACQGPGAEPALRAPPPYRLRYNAATDYLSLERSHRPMTPDLQGANLDTCSIAEEGGNDGDARQMVAPSPTSAAAQASGVQTRQSALAAAAGRMYASVAGKGKAAPASAGAAVGAHEHKANGSADAGPAGTRHHTDSPTPHARSVGSEATWGPHHDRERSRPRSFTPQPWISGTSGESSLIAEPALDRLRASPAPNGGGLFAQQTGGGRAGASWMREPARESASPMSRIQTAAPAGPAAAEGRASISRQPSGGLLAPPSAVTWRSGTPSALAREPRRMNTLSIESVSASAAGSPGLRASHSPPPTQAGCPEAAPSLPSLPPPAPTPAPKRQRPPRAADVAAAAREAAAEAGGARGSSRGRAAVPTDAAHQPLAPIGESDGADEGGDAAAACGTADDEHDHGHQRIGISKDAAGLWQITLKDGDNLLFYGGDHGTPEAAAEQYHQLALLTLPKQGAELCGRDLVRTGSLDSIPTAQESSAPAAASGGRGAKRGRGGSWPGAPRRSSRFKGVSWCQSSGKWRGQCWDGSKVKYIGYFETEEGAARAYDKAVVQTRGSTAQTNFPRANPSGSRTDQPAQDTSEVHAAAAAIVLAGCGHVAAADEASMSVDGRTETPAKGGTSRFKGVSWSSRSRKWRAQLWFSSNIHHLGFFDAEEDAARAYDRAVVELRGPDARTNFEVGGGAGGAAAGTQRSGVAGTATETPEQLIARVVAAAAVVANGDGGAASNGSKASASSKYRGVRWHPHNNKWEARIFNGAKQVSLGYSTSESGAAQIYDREALRLRGSAAQLNFPLWSLSDAAAAATAPGEQDTQVADEARTEPLPQAARSGPANVDAPRAATATRSTGSGPAPLRRSMRRSSASARSAGSNKRPSLSDPTTHRDEAAAGGVPAWGNKRARCSSTDTEQASPSHGLSRRAAAGTADADSAPPVAGANPATTAEPLAADSGVRRRSGTSRRVRRPPARAAE